jgi:hypothetical protein
MSQVKKNFLTIFAIVAVLSFLPAAMVLSAPPDDPEKAAKVAHDKRRIALQHDLLRCMREHGGLVRHNLSKQRLKSLGNDENAIRVPAWQLRDDCLKLMAAFDAEVKSRSPTRTDAEEAETAADELRARKLTDEANKQRQELIQKGVLKP